MGCTTENGVFDLAENAHRHSSLLGAATRLGEGRLSGNRNEREGKESQICKFAPLACKRLKIRAALPEIGEQTWT
jgi:hypothetical protein